jgi:hypothetical protein
MKQLIGYVETFEVDRYSNTNGVTVTTEGFVTDLMLAAFELSIINGALYVFKLLEKKYDGERDVVLITNNFTIISK